MEMATVAVPESVAAWVREQAAAMGVPTRVVWLALVDIAVDAEKSMFHSIRFAVEDAKREEKKVCG